MKDLSPQLSSDKDGCVETKACDILSDATPETCRFIPISYLFQADWFRSQPMMQTAAPECVQFSSVPDKVVMQRTGVESDLGGAVLSRKLNE